jgi:putative ATP-binding cassette transporter
MRLLRFLFQISPKIVLSATLVGLVAGTTTTGLIMTINGALRDQPLQPQRLAGRFVALAVVMILSNLASRFLLIYLAQDAVYSLRMSLCKQILWAQLRQIEELGGSTLMVALTDDVLTISNALLGLPALCVGLAIICTCILYLGYLSLIMMLIVLGFMGAGLAGYQLISNKALKYLRIAREEQSSLFRNYRALVEGSKELQLHRDRREEFWSSKLEASAKITRRASLAGLAGYGAAETYGQLLFFVFMGIIIFAVPSFHRVSVPVLTSYVITMLYMMTPLQATLNILPILGRAQIAMRQIEKLNVRLDSAARENGQAAETTKSQEYCLELRGVTRCYTTETDDRTFVLGPLGLTFSSGEIVFVIGGNGSGKTTLAKVITGLYPPESGEIWLNGSRVTNSLADCYRKHFSAVFSEFFLFDSLLGLDWRDAEARLLHYLEKFQLQHKISVRDGIFSTIDLSRGQKKRLALLVAYLEDRPFYVFDEWASDQDPSFKRIFYEDLLLDLKARGKAVIVITHDDRYFDIPDRIIRLDNGEVRETISLRPLEAKEA